jgi:hypothetical protein
MTSLARLATTGAGPTAFDDETCAGVQVRKQRECIGPIAAYKGVFGNSIAIASFDESATELRIESRLHLETYAAEQPRSEIAPEAASYPFIYSAHNRIDLGRMLELHHPDPSDRLGCWARERARPTTCAQVPGLPRCAAEHAELKIIEHQFVKGFASAPVNLRRGCVNQVAVAIERAQKSFFIKSHARLNPLQRIPIHEK